jgi:hypothetical protein
VTREEAAKWLDYFTNTIATTMEWRGFDRIHVDNLRAIAAMLREPSTAATVSEGRVEVGGFTFDRICGGWGVARAGDRTRITTRAEHALLDALLAAKADAKREVGRELRARLKGACELFVTHADLPLLDPRRVDVTIDEVCGKGEA